MTLQKRPDPLPVPQAEHSPEVSGRYFGKHSNARDAAKLKRLNPEEYARVRRSAVIHGQIDEPPYFSKEYDVPAAPPARVLSTAEIAARQEFSEEFLRALYAGKSEGETLGEIRKSDPAKYERIRLAAASRNIVPAERPALKKPPTPKTEVAEPNDGLVALPADIAAKLKVPAGTRVTPSDLAALLKTEADAQIEKSHAAMLEANRVANAEKDTLEKSIARAVAAQTAAHLATGQLT